MDIRHKEGLPRQGGVEELDWVTDEAMKRSSFLQGLTTENLGEPSRSCAQPSPAKW